MKNLLITSSEIAEKLNQVVKKYGHSYTQNYLFINAYFNLKDRKDNAFEQPTLIFSNQDCEIDFCNACSITGCEFLGYGNFREEIIYEGYMNSIFGELCSKAFRMAAYMTNHSRDDFFTDSSDDLGIEVYTDIMKEFCADLQQKSEMVGEFWYMDNDKARIINVFCGDELGAMC